MKTTAQRIREVRKFLKFNQTEFGEKLGLNRDVISNIELDRNKNGVPDNIIKLISMTFNINEDWLRTGEGEMIQTKTKETEIASFLGSVLNEQDQFKTAFIKTLSKLGVEEWKMIENFIEELQKNKAE